MRKIWTLIGIFAIVALLAAPAAADTLTFYFDTPFNDKPLPDGASPWLTAVFDDEGIEGSVLLTLTANLTNGNFISEVYFNLDPEGSLTSGVVVDRTAPAPTAGLVSPDAYKADGAGYFDFLIQFPTAAADRFEGTEYITFELFGAGLTAASFDYFSTSSANGEWQAAAHIQNISDPEGSTWIAGTGGSEVPVPGAVWLLGSGLIGLVGLRRKFK
jgi:hypothetical protein